jgi:hypothetical protein
VDAAAAQPGQLAEAQAGAEQGGDVVPPVQRKQASSRPASSGRERAALGLGEDVLGVGAPLGRRHLRHWIGVDRALGHGELEERDRAITVEREARRQGLRTEVERLERLIAEARQEVEQLREATTGDLGLRVESVRS